MPKELPELLVAESAAWRRWLTANHCDVDGVWLARVRARRLRWGARWPALLAAGGLLLCGCGGHGAPSSPSSTASSSTASAPRRAARRHGRHAGRPAARAQTLAYARAVNIRAGDVPGFAVSSERDHEHESSSEKRFERKFLACAGLSGHGSESSPEASSPSFERKRGIVSASVSSSVSIAGSALLAETQARAFASGRLRTCLARAFDGLMRAERPRGAQVGPVSVKYGSPPAPGASASFGLRVTADLTLRHIPIPFYMDLLGFSYGRAEVMLFTIGLPAPFPAALEEELFTLLLRRAKARAS